jgi:beta-xylosidase
MPKPLSSCILIFASFLLCVSARADRLRIDFNQRNSGDFPVHTMEDFDAFVLNTSPQTTPVIWKYGTLTVTLWHVLGNGLEDRRRTAVINTATFTNAQILQDFVFNQGATQLNSGLSLRIAGLASNQIHQLTIWSYDYASGGTRVSDWYANGILVTNNYTFIGSVLPTANSDHHFSFTAVSDANGEILIEGKRDASSLENGVAATGVFLNGLEIDGIPSQSPPCGTLDHFQPGSNLYGWFGGNSIEEQDMEVAALAEAGAKWVRINVVWHAVEPTQKGVYDSGALAMYDNLMARLAENGMKAIFVTADTPYWASADPNKANGLWAQKYKPSNFSDLADYYAFLANRYESTGPHAFEIWNEQNEHYFWPSGVNATNYVAMLQSCYAAIKAVDPQAIVLNGGLTDNGGAGVNGAINYMNAMYNAGAKNYFDAWSQHTYPRTPQYEAIISQVRNVMVARGDSAKKIWMTEWGWVTYTNTADASAVSYQRQAHYLTNMLTRMASYPYVEVGVWYTSRSYNENEHEGSFGLALPDFTKKPSFFAFKDWVASAGRHCFPAFMTMSPPVLQNGSVRIQFEADPQFVYTLQASGNFLNWTNLSTNLTSTSNTFVFNDPTVVSTNRFYRLKW